MVCLLFPAAQFHKQKPQWVVFVTTEECSPECSPKP